jgi:1-deoxy-D-xylulose-5-phosphate synthase
MGIPDRLVEHGSPKQLYEEIGLDANGIAATIREMILVNVKAIPMA